MIFLLCSNIQSQSKEEKLVLDFLSACKDENIDMRLIKEKYLCKSKDMTKEQATKILILLY